MRKQSVAIGSKGNGSMAIGVKAKGGEDKVAALRNQFEIEQFRSGISR